MNEQEFIGTCHYLLNEISGVVHGFPSAVSITSAMGLVENIINKVTDEDEKEVILEILRVSFESFIVTLKREDWEN